MTSLMDNGCLDFSVYMAQPGCNPLSLSSWPLVAGLCFLDATLLLQWSYSNDESKIFIKTFTSDYSRMTLSLSVNLWYDEAEQAVITHAPGPRPWAHQTRTISSSWMPSYSQYKVWVIFTTNFLIFLGESHCQRKKYSVRELMSK